MLFHRLAGAMAGAALTFGLAAAQPAWAQIDVQIDTDYILDLRNVGVCSVGNACSTSYSLGFNVTRPDGSTFNNVYLYREGVVGLGAALPTGATTANLASLGNAFLAPGLDAYAGMNVEVRIATHGGYFAESMNAAAQPLETAYRLANLQWQVTDPIRDPVDMDGEPIPNGQGDYLGIFQVQIGNLGVIGAGHDPLLGPEGSNLFAPTGDPRVQVTYRYGAPFGADGDILAGIGYRPGLGITDDSLIGYRLGSLGGSYGQPLGGRPSFVLGPVGGPRPVVPEPGAWALMIAGFGLTGSMLRRRRNSTPA